MKGNLCLKFHSRFYIVPVPFSICWKIYLSTPATTNLTNLIESVRPILFINIESKPVKTVKNAGLTITEYHRHGSQSFLTVLESQFLLKILLIVQSLIYNESIIRLYPTPQPMVGYLYMCYTYTLSRCPTNRNSVSQSVGKVLPNIYTATTEKPEAKPVILYLSVTLFLYVNIIKGFWIVCMYII